MKKFRFTALLLACALLFCTLPATAVETASPLLPKVRSYPGFADVKGSWCETAVKTVYEAGLMDGVSKTGFSPGIRLNYGQIFAIAARLHSRLTGGTGQLPAAKQGELWCQPAYRYVLANFKEIGYSTMGPNSDPSFFAQLCERRFFVDTLSAALTAAKVTLPSINQVDDIPDGGSSPAEAVFAFYRAGILAGKNKYGFFDGAGVLTRGEAAAMLARIVDPSQRLTVSLTKSFDLYEALGTKAETMLFRIADTDVTAGQCAYLLATGITTIQQNNDSTLAWSEAHTLASVKEVFAIAYLAEQLGPTGSLSKEELAQLEAQAAAQAGESGASKESWLWYKQAEARYEKVRLAYFAEFGTANSPYPVLPEFTEALKSTAASLSLEPTAAYEALDLAAFQKALLDSGYYSLHGIPPSRM